MIDKHFYKHKRNYLIQSLLAMVMIFTILHVLDIVGHTMAFRIIGSTSLGASTFIAFSVPHTETARARNILGGYGIAIVVGICGYFIANRVDLLFFLMHERFVYEFSAALVLGAIVWLMNLFNLQHPPAAGFGVGVVVDVWDINSLIVILGAVIFLAFFKTALRKRIINLF